MEQSVQLFNFKDQDIRVVFANNNPHWVLADVCKPLDLGDPSRVADRLDPKGTTFSRVLSAGGYQEMLCINEPNLYRTIFRSNKPEAKAFQDWVFEVLLPKIRKDGYYCIPQKQISEFELFDMPNELRQTIEQEEDQILAMTKHVNFLKYGEQLRYPQQSQTRGKRKTSLPKVFIHEGVEITQLVILFGEDIA
jgi:prophage antirepressor-like protein